MYLLAAEVRVLDFGNCVNEYVNALVPVLVTSADTDEDSVLRHLAAGHCRSDRTQFASCGVALLVILLVGRRRETVLEAVRRNHIHLPSEEMLTFYCSDFADRSEHVSIFRRLLLERMECGDIELSRLFFSVVRLHGVIQRKIVSGKATAHDSRVGRKYRCYRKFLIFQIQDTCTCLPFMELRNNLVGR